MKFSRRDFVVTTALGTASLALNAQVTKESDRNTRPAQKETKDTSNRAWKKPVIISAANGINYIDAGYARLRQGGDTLDAIMEVIKGPENDPKDDSVGLGGLPNEEGVVELDACCMHGPSRRAGAVAGVRNIKNVAALAKTVMERTGHVMLVGEGAERFAYAHGFPKENLLTEDSRKTWLLWKESMSNSDWWGPGLADPSFKFPDEMNMSEFEKPRMRRLHELAEEIGIAPEKRMAAIHKVMYPPTGTINCSSLNEKGEMSSATTTSGLAWKIPGRAGDSPIIGAGCFCDPDVGAAGATGNGEENIKVVGAHTIVENMRHGMSPVEAGLDALKRIAHNYNNDEKKLRYLNMIYYILRKDGAYASVTLWSGPADRPRKFAVHDGEKRLEASTALFQGVALGWPPMPQKKAAGK